MSGTIGAHDAATVAPARPWANVPRRHVYRVELFLLMLELPYRFADSPATLRQSEAFRRLDPFGQVPVLQDGDWVLADSNAFLVYLAKKYAPDSQWLPEDPVGASQVQRWLSIAAGEVKFGVRSS
jgi:glutathione S-transferase